jgi:allantoin racemase
MKIKIITPIITDRFNTQVTEEAKQFTAPDTEIDVENITRGSASIESSYDDVLNGPEIVKLTVQAEKDGYDAVFIDCFGDPAVEAARELVTIPVVGGFQPAVLTASGLCGRFSIITVLPSVVSLLRGLVRKQGITENVASVRCVNIAVLDLDKSGALLDTLVAEAEKSIHDDGAEGIVLGCTGMLGLAKSVENELAGRGLTIPVIDPTGSALGMLQSFVRNSLTHSRLTYHFPPEKERKV